MEGCVEANSCAEIGISRSSSPRKRKLRLSNYKKTVLEQVEVKNCKKLSTRS